MVTPAIVGFVQDIASDETLPPYTVARAKELLDREEKRGKLQVQLELIGQSGLSQHNGAYLYEGSEDEPVSRVMLDAVQFEDLDTPRVLTVVLTRAL